METGFYYLLKDRQASHAWGPNAHENFPALVGHVKSPERVSIGKQHWAMR